MPTATHSLNECGTNKLAISMAERTPAIALIHADTNVLNRCMTPPFFPVWLLRSMTATYPRSPTRPFLPGPRQTCDDLWHSLPCMQVLASIRPDRADRRHCGEVPWQASRSINPNVLPQEWLASSICC